MLGNPLFLAAIGGVVVTGAIVVNVVLWDDESDVAPPSPAEQVAAAPVANSAPIKNLETRTLPNPEKAPKAKVVEPVSVVSKPAEPNANRSVEPKTNTSVEPKADISVEPKTNKSVEPKADISVEPKTNIPEKIVEQASVANNREETQSSEPASDKAAPPTFDVVRITPDGNAVVAGRAKPGSRVVILDNGQFAGQLDADAHGEWVFVPEKPFAPGSRQLGLEMHVEGQKPVPSDDVVVLVVPEANKDIAGRKTDKPTRSLALKFPKKGGVSTVLQKPSGDPGTNILSVETVDYDDAGRLLISGRAEPSASVFVYLDNAIAGKVKVNSDGIWQMQPEQRVEPGIYTLRADQLKSDGSVLARVSMPFSRAEPMEEMPSEPFVIVQPGNSLWRIARNTYGSGFGFTTIYEANKDQIIDPDMIFPGQVFALPSNNL